MQPYPRVGMSKSHLNGYARSHVASPYSKALVSQLVNHKLLEENCDTGNGHAFLSWPIGESVAWQRRDDDIEGIGSAAAMTLGVG